MKLHTPNDNSPITALRVTAGLSQAAFAKMLNLNIQTLYQAECGLFPELPSSIIQAAFKFDTEPHTFRKRYHKFVQSKRTAFGEALKQEGVVLVVPSDATVAPVTCLWTCSNLTCTQFCKQAAILPATMYRLKNGQAKNLGSQIENALRELGIKDSFVEELNDAQEEFYFSMKRPEFKRQVLAVPTSNSINPVEILVDMD